ncbi:condensation domain-containing protein [Streptomyces sp. B-S-A8]|uniref:Condensation domain-containing protein n=1 Tax=Streptomyces solicavernae TaxID=3043614 RepID=A0ABT6S1P5_9ACTN|nr:condensation domain-containing protein [Streptomyces sp. B-S-A8]MDI3390599.1 condensation domain-containing protein [Streptomyces sp. B-S-A8]
MTGTRDVAGSLTVVLALGGPARQEPSTLDLCGPARQEPSTLDLCGPFDPSFLDAALARIAADRPQLREARPRIVRRGPGRYVLELAAPYPVGVLADLLTAACAPGVSGHQAAMQPPEPLALTPLQCELLSDQASSPQHHVGQLLWRWHGPLDTARFRTAWQSVFCHETVLRAAFVWDPGPRLALHDRAHPDAVRHPHGTLTRQALMEQERARGFDLGRPGLLRVALLDGQPRQPGSALPYTDVVLTYHRSVLDSWSAGLLVREFYRRYLAGDRPRGGERRPDLRDYRRWLAAQDPGAARDFWARPGGIPGAGLPRAGSGAATGRIGMGSTRIRLTLAETERLVHWAAHWGVTEYSVLQTVWALLLYRAGTADRGRPGPVGFNVAVSGRAIPMEGVAYLPGPFDNPLPMTLHVDPDGTVPALLRAARDQGLGMSAYEWVSAGQIRRWLGHEAAVRPDTQVSFEHRQSHLEGLEPELAAHGLLVTDIEPAGGGNGCAISVAARYDSGGGSSS